MKLLLLFFTFSLLFLSYSSFGQQSFSPQEGESVNYLFVPFSITPVQGAQGYELEVMQGFVLDDATFSAQKIKIAVSAKPKVIAKLPFGYKNYTWRMNAVDANGVAIPATLHHFTATLPQSMDSEHLRLRIVKPATAYKDAYIMVDGSKAIYDMNGQMVWYLKNLPGDKETEVRDIKLTANHTLTLLYGSKAIEIDYKNKLLWSAPLNDDTTKEPDEKYHHEVIKLANGHIMVMSSVPVYFSKDPNRKDTVLAINDQIANNDPQRNQKYQKVLFAKLIEYDKQGKQVWEWNSKGFFNLNDIYYRKSPHTVGNFYLHGNAFHFDTKKSMIYISFKGISQILKIHYPDGKAVATFGKKVLDDYQNAPFCEQHCCRLNKAGELMVFNNNMLNEQGRPCAQIYKENPSKKYGLQKIWEWDCLLNNNTHIPTQDDKARFGSINELPGGTDLLISVCGQFGDMFIVNRSKEILWHAIAERWDNQRKDWAPAPTYRTDYILTQKELEKMIEVSEGGK
ncbi:MAG: hypothetical protein EBX41_06145 [Chitinophagia bacterium]|nr:hypothetical protein [Chitinophagia bacterium]